MRQAARTVPIAGTAWGRALLASCLHMLAADIPGNPKKISDNLQYTAYFKSRPQVPVQTVFHYLPQVDYIRNSFLKGNLFFLLNSEGYLNYCTLSSMQGSYSKGYYKKCMKFS